jgi:hypothetical protein
MHNQLTLHVQALLRFLERLDDDEFVLLVLGDLFFLNLLTVPSLPFPSSQSNSYSAPFNDTTCLAGSAAGMNLFGQALSIAFSMPWPVIA